MNCAQIRHLLDAYLDGELDAVHTLEIDQHLQGCPLCAALYKDRQTLHALIKDTPLYYRASSALEQRVRRSVQQADTRPLARWEQSKRWLMLAAAALLAIIVLSGVLLVSTAGSSALANNVLANEVLASHLRSLMAGHLTDIGSTDQHTVKPWFDGKLDFSPLVIDLTAQGFPLIGGRLDYLDNRPIAALVYQRRKHFINVFTWPITSDDGSKTAEVSLNLQGYQLFHWVQGDMNYWAVSDIAASDLQDFVHNLQS